MLILSFLLAPLVAILLAPTIADIISVIRGRSQPPRTGVDGDVPRLIFLIPAHDEELLISACLATIAALDYPKDRLTTVVVADNCTDATADHARRAGVICYERTDTTQRGKPYAIAWALPRLTLDQADAVIVLDADTLLDADFARALARRAPLNDKIVQGYIDVSNRTETALTRMAAVLSTIRFRIVDQLKERCGLNVPLGDGVCIGTGVLETYGWTAYAASETWELYLSMTVHGVRCECEADAHLYAQEARSLKQSASQRRRWTTGRLDVLLKYAGPLLRSRNTSGFQKVDALAELLGLGPAAHVAIVAVLIAVLAIAQPPAAVWLALALALSVGRLVLYTVLAVSRENDRWATVRAFAFLPLYAVWRLGVQIRSMIAVRDRTWVRTSRHVATEKSPPD
jgi:1,2-diacylglycerol 3-beta-glucosyltransferase